MKDNTYLQQNCLCLELLQATKHFGFLNCNNKLRLHFQKNLA